MEISNYNHALRKRAAPPRIFNWSLRPVKVARVDFGGA